MDVDLLDVTIAESCLWHLERLEQAKPAAYRALPISEGAWCEAMREHRIEEMGAVIERLVKDGSVVRISHPLFSDVCFYRTRKV